MSHHRRHHSLPKFFRQFCFRHVCTLAAKHIHHFRKHLLSLSTLNTVHTVVCWVGDLVVPENFCPHNLFCYIYDHNICKIWASYGHDSCENYLAKEKNSNGLCFGVSQLLIKTCIIFQAVHVPMGRDKCQLLIWKTLYCQQKITFQKHKTVSCSMSRECTHGLFWQFSSNIFTQALIAADDGKLIAESHLLSVSVSQLEWTHSASMTWIFRYPMPPVWSGSLNRAAFT